MLNTADETGRVEIMSANWCSSLKYHELNPSGACTHSCIHRSTLTPRPHHARHCSRHRDASVNNATQGPFPSGSHRTCSGGGRIQRDIRSISLSPGTRNLEEGYQCNLNTERGINISHPTFRTHCEDMQVSHPLFTDSRTETRDA